MLVDSFFSRFGRRLIIIYSLVFSVILSFSGIFLYVQIRRITTESVNEKLNVISDSLRERIEFKLEEKSVQIKKDLIVAQYHIDTEDIRIFDTDSVVMETVSISDDLSEVRRIYTLMVGENRLTGNQNLLESITDETGGTVTLFQNVDDGLVATTTTLRDADGKLMTGLFIPRTMAQYRLISDSFGYIGRDYIGGEWHFVASRPLYDTHGVFVGALYVTQKQLDLNRLRNDIEYFRIGQNGFVFIMDSSGTMIVHRNLEGENLIDFKFIRRIQFLQNGMIRYKAPAKIDPKQVLYQASFRAIPDVNWIVVANAEVAEAYSALRLVRIMFLLIIGSALAATWILDVIIARRVTLPIRQITQKVKEISEGEADLQRHLDIHSRDEIGDLANYFNTFIAKLKTLNDLEHRNAEINLRDAQTRALEAQINPHFLYNTLETIYFMVNMNDSRSMDMIKNLGDLFRASIDCHERFHKFRDELNHVRLYVRIQEVRYSGRFRFLIDIPDEIMDSFTLRFLIQPIVENAIVHGMENVEEGGLISISAVRIESSVFVSITDNGCGMSTEHLNELTSALLKDDQNVGIGMKNVHNRIILHFGKQFGINLNLNNDGGVTVCIRIPFLKQEPDSSSFTYNTGPRYLTSK